jgi:SAM-dependent methyltransferase
MDEPQALERMRADWNGRAGEDANYYVAFGRRRQDDEEFFASAADVVRRLEAGLNRLRARAAALEIGCGPGRLMRPLSRHFAAIHGVDISEDMIRLARERLRGTPNAHPHHSSGSDLALFGDATFDFVYSYAVFQHIPSREVVFRYLREARRVLKPGGILRCQINGLPPTAKEYDTWNGVRISPDEIRRFAVEQEMALLELDQIWTQYMWVTLRKPGLPPRPAAGAARVRNTTDAPTGEAAAPARGALASLSLWIERLPAACDLNNIAVTAEGRPCRGMYVGEPDYQGVSQVNVALPEGIRTGLVPVEVSLHGEPLCSGWARIIPPGPLVPRIIAVSDGVDLLSGTEVASGIVKVSLCDVADPGGFRAAVDGRDAGEAESFCVDLAAGRYEFNFRVPEGIGPGRHEVRIALGKRRFAPVPIEVL